MREWTFPAGTVEKPRRGIDRVGDLLAPRRGDGHEGHGVIL
ncbi:hypothetical protein [Halomonas ramblicola]|nr:hypothetical protein [Halomonas ramblicola]MDN3522688.1 hypothetical protein [Halomonas ramblicola]